MGLTFSVENEEHPASKGQRSLSDGLYFVHVDWCGHCKRALPAMEEICAKYSALAHTVNVTNNPSEFEMLQTRSYPKYVFVKDSEAQEYNGPRDFDSLQSKLVAILY